MTQTVVQDIEAVLRKHEPSPRELVADIAATKELILEKFSAVRELVAAGDKLYQERYTAQKTAVDDALAAVKEQTTAQFAASEKAIVKAEESQKTYNQGHNNLSRKMEQQYATMVPQAEAQLKWNSVDKAIEDLRKDVAITKTSEQTDISGLRIELMKEISNLRESRSSTEGSSSGSKVVLGYIIAGTGLIISAVIALSHWRVL